METVVFSFKKQQRELKEMTSMNLQNTIQFENREKPKNSTELLAEAFEVLEKKECVNA